MNTETVKKRTRLFYTTDHLRADASAVSSTYRFSLQFLAIKTKPNLVTRTMLTTL